MLSNIASYLLGSNTVDTQVALEPNVRLVEAEEDEGADGWVVIHKTTVPEDDADDEIIVEVEGEKRNDECHQEHNFSVAVNCASLNNSWFVTPPPCFTSTGPIDMETSPFENLLIEHPSMSVYQHRTLSNTTMSSSTPTTIPTVQRAASEPPPEREITFVDVPRNCPTSGSSLQHLKRQQEKLQKLKALAAQKGCERRANQGLKRGQLAKRDKARECSQRRHRPRRCERQPRNSAANNNRKC